VVCNAATRPHNPSRRSPSRRGRRLGAAAATTTGVALAGSPAGRVVGLQACAARVGVVVGSVAAMAVIATLGRRLLRLGTNL
jgi:hypothetical protein